MTPNPDVASGRYQQAEFGADLGQVYRREGSEDYSVLPEFHRRTFPTEGLTKLLRIRGQAPTLTLNTAKRAAAGAGASGGSAQRPDRR